MSCVPYQRCAVRHIRFSVPKGGLCQMKNRWKFERRRKPSGHRRQPGEIAPERARLGVVISLAYFPRRGDEQHGPPAWPRIHFRQRQFAKAGGRVDPRDDLSGRQIARPPHDSRDETEWIALTRDADAQGVAYVGAAAIVANDESAASRPPAISPQPADAADLSLSGKQAADVHAAQDLHVARLQSCAENNLACATRLGR